MKKAVKIIAAAAAIVMALSGCSAASQTGGAAPNEETVKLHTYSQSAFLGSSDSLIGVYARGTDEKSRPKPVELEWDGDDGSVVISISESEDMSDAATYDAQGGSLEVYNLKIGTDYYWTVTSSAGVSEVYTFTTADEAPRNLYIDGITNARDVGGRRTQSGARVKQGMIYRCGRLNESDVDYVNIEITQSGKSVMLDELGIKTEIDVRLDYNNENGTITESPLGSGVQYINCPMEWDGEMLSQNREQIARVFSVLADESSYPLCIHCNIGTDRTGMLCFMINALLGVSEEELYDDYLFSNFGNIGGKRPLKNLTESDYYRAIIASDGETLSEKTYNCLVSNGVSAADIDAMIRIMTEN